MKLFFACAATVLRKISYCPFVWTGKQLADAANWCEARS